jgi:hypothetical protein
MIDLKLQPGGHQAVSPQGLAIRNHKRVGMVQEGTHEGLCVQKLGWGFIPGLGNVATQVTEACYLTGCNCTALGVCTQVESVCSHAICSQHGMSLDGSGIIRCDTKGVQPAPNVEVVQHDVPEVFKGHNLGRWDLKAWYVEEGSC